MQVEPLTRASLKQFPLPPVEDGGKETKGRILVVAGSRSMPGSALLAATAAMRAGAGKLRIATVRSIAPHVAAAMPEAFVDGLDEDEQGGIAASAVASIGTQAGKATAIVAGPGMERNQACEAIATALLDSSAKLVLDAALLRKLRPCDGRRTEEQCLPILLPHAGELASLLDCERDEVEADPLASGLEASRRYRANVLVKGVQSHVVTPDGRAWRFTGGAPGLGVSGSGDVLAGIAGGLLASRADPLTALLWSVLLHGEAGERLSKTIGPAGFLAREIPGEIPALLARAD
jgi:ADP-dependent NAD(P)H-hydrate dehydratase